MAAKKTKKKKPTNTTAPQTLEFEYVTQPGWILAPVNGVVGHVRADGMIIAGLYCEHLPPFKTVREIKDGVVGAEKHLQVRNNAKRFERRILQTAVMTPSAARVVGQWLLDNAVKAEEMVRGRSK